METRWSRLTDVFDDGQVLLDAACEHGLEGIVAKRATSLYRAGQRGWIKLKNPAYWRRKPGDRVVTSFARSTPCWCRRPAVVTREVGRRVRSVDERCARG